MESLINLKKQRKKKFYVIEELNKLNTKRLLDFYKKERKIYFSFYSGSWCECCGEPMSIVYSTDKYYTDEMPKIIDEWKLYLDLIKKILDKREHIENKN